MPLGKLAVLWCGMRVVWYAPASVRCSTTASQLGAYLPMVGQLLLSMVWAATVNDAACELLAAGRNHKLACTPM